MTLILGAQNDSYTFLFVDRRISYASGNKSIIVKEEFNKTGLVKFVDGFLSYAFTGPAPISGIRMDWWIAKVILDSGGPYIRQVDFFERFEKVLTERFSNEKVIQAYPEKERRFSVHFFGYFYPGNDIMGRTIIVSNFDNPTKTNINGFKGEFSDLPWEKFETFPFVQGSMPRSEYSCVIPRGNWKAIDIQRVNKELIPLLKTEHKITKKINRICLNLMWGASSSKFGGNIGKQINSIYIPHDTRVSPIFKYYGKSDSRDSDTPLFINFFSLNPYIFPSLIITQRSGKMKDQYTCYCGSGKRYKNCHKKSDKKDHIKTVSISEKFPGTICGVDKQGDTYV